MLAIFSVAVCDVDWSSVMLVSHLRSAALRRFTKTCLFKMYVLNIMMDRQLHRLFIRFIMAYIHSYSIYHNIIPQYTVYLVS